MRPSYFESFVAKAVSSTTTYHGDPMRCDQMVSASVQIIMTGSSVTGSATFEFSNDPFTEGNPTNWVKIPGTENTVAIDGSTALVYGIPAQDISYNWIRVSYTNATNSGTITAQIKGVAF